VILVIQEEQSENLNKQDAANLPDPVDLHVGKQLQLRRKLMGRSQQQVADHLGVTFQQIQKYETGTNRISASSLYYIGQYLSVNVEYFFEGISLTRNIGFRENQQQSLEDMPRPYYDIVLQPDVKELVISYDAVRDESLRQAVLALAKSLVSKKLESAQ